MKLFIDTNVYLSFFHYTKNDVDELDKLAELINQGGIELLLPSQVYEEFYRNREAKISQAIKSLKDQNLNLQFPEITKEYAEYETLRELQREYDRNHATLLEKIREDAVQQNHKADKLIQKLFDLSTRIQTTDELIKLARDRVDIGNPPGKRGSLGDAINWESLLDFVPEGEDLFFVTEDGDFYSPLDNGEFNLFLKLEWKAKKESGLKYFKQISAFFKTYFDYIKLADEAVKNELIQQLAQSGSFSQTHSIVAKLSKYTEFSPTQLENIIDATLYNDQIHWIINDEDVEEFINNVLASSVGIVDFRKINKIRSFVENENEDLLYESHMKDLLAEFED